MRRSSIVCLPTTACIHHSPGGFQPGRGSRVSGDGVSRREWGRNSDGGGERMLLAREWTESGGNRDSIGSGNQDEGSLNDGIWIRSPIWMGIELRQGLEGELR